MKILIVDDSKAMRMIVMRTLRQAGFGDHEFIEAGNGSEGIQKVKSENPGLILSDWNMPVMSGIELVEAVRARRELNSLKLIMVTSNTELERMARALEAGADDYMMKPFTKEALLERLRFHRLVPGGA